MKRFAQPVAEAGHILVTTQEMPSVVVRAAKAARQADNDGAIVEAWVLRYRTAVSPLLLLSAYFFSCRRGLLFALLCIVLRYHAAAAIVWCYDRDRERYCCTKMMARSPFVHTITLP